MNAIHETWSPRKLSMRERAQLTDTVPTEEVEVDVDIIDEQHIILTITVELPESSIESTLVNLTPDEAKTLGAGLMKAADTVLNHRSGDVDVVNKREPRPVPAPSEFSRGKNGRK